MARDIEWVELEVTVKSHQVQLPCSKQEHVQLDQVAQSPIHMTLNIYMDRASATSLGNLFQCCTSQCFK